MLAKSATPAEILAQETHQQQMENHPVIRTLYDHNAVSQLHPRLSRCLGIIPLIDIESVQLPSTQSRRQPGEID